MSNLARKEPAVGAPPMPAPASEATPEAPPLVQPVTVAEETDSLAVLKPVPRITIHAFCEQPGTGSAIQRASEDRRLAKAHLTVHMGGIPGAIENYQQTATPNLIMVETRIGGPALFHQLG
ncbi:MAG TPA: CtpF protein, partial [Rhodobiaceae bacterium]|nr:CtpF protein [Rhodobiaceae bacterium]